jgi:hypothetical protein
MPRNKIEMILNIQKSCSEPLYAILDGITEEQLTR